MYLILCYLSYYILSSYHLKMEGTVGLFLEKNKFAPTFGKKNIFAASSLKKNKFSPSSLKKNKFALLGCYILLEKNSLQHRTVSNVEKKYSLETVEKKIFSPRKHVKKINSLEVKALRSTPILNGSRLI